MGRAFCPAFFIYLILEAKRAMTEPRMAMRPRETRRLKAWAMKGITGRAKEKTQVSDCRDSGQRYSGRKDF